jgi:PiT family inorganic phosphate transporter
MAADTSSAAIILSSSHLGMALSTTHVATGSILGSGVGRRGATGVRWSLAGRMITAWLITLPAAGVVGALCWFLADLIGGGAGVAVVFMILVVASGLMFRHSRRTQITHSNVNDAWQGKKQGKKKKKKAGPKNGPPVKIAA